jgi:hypothetical protein
MSLVGRLEDLALPDIFQIISLSKKTGTLIVRSRKGTGMVVFKNGQVFQAESDGIRDSLGNILVSQGMLNEEALAKALALQKRETDTPLGMILTGMGAVSAQTLESVVRKQIEEIIYDLLAWEEGFFNFELGEIASKDKIEIDTSSFLSPASAPVSAHQGRILDEKRKDERSPAPARAAQPTSPSHRVSWLPPGRIRSHREGRVLAGDHRAQIHVRRAPLPDGHGRGDAPHPPVRE